MEEKKNNKPDFTLLEGRICASVWKKERKIKGITTEVFSIKISRTYFRGKTLVFDQYFWVKDLDKIKLVIDKVKQKLDGLEN